MSFDHGSYRGPYTGRGLIRNRYIKALQSNLFCSFLLYTLCAHIAEEICKMCVYIYIYTHTRICATLIHYVYVYVYICAIYKYIHIYIHIYICICAYVNKQRHVYTYMHIHIHAYIHAYVYVHRERGVYDKKLQQASALGMESLFKEQKTEA